LLPAWVAVIVTQRKNTTKEFPMSCCARYPSVFRRVFAACLLFTGFALPLHAWAVDTDGDGVDDSIDAFPNNAEATTDTDGDGKPDSINTSKLILLSGFSTSSPWTQTGNGFSGWTQVSTGVVRGTGGGMLGGTGKKLSITITVPAAGATMTYIASSVAAWGGYTQGPGGTFVPPQNYNVSTGLSAGTKTLNWSVGTYCSGGTCSTATGHDLSNLLVIANTSLTEDTDDDADGILDVSDTYPLDTDNDGINNATDMDDDNDGVPDYIDANPLNATIHNEITLPVNSTYKGGQVREVQSRQ
jgi:hypothetical protein